ncbi:hypothetical protein LWI29_001364 [Acer saccharum]|uniref:Retrotransposon gag domain-containing protein n=1 Tax=Acer saccharum TaxID=4024 RepID=A0AA39VIA5_ACESA|nr:hypothetical protein LWI29_001364 [Acer saccharum]
MIQRMSSEMNQKIAALNSKYDHLSESMSNMRTEASGSRSSGSTPSNDNGSTHKRAEYHRSISTRTIRLEFPKFQGDDPSRWLYCAERFFEYHQTPEAQQVKIASFHLDGEALQWFKWVTNVVEFPDWSNFKQALSSRFGPTEYEDYAESLAKLRQIGSLREYQREFEKLANHVTGLPESFLRKLSCAGRRPELPITLQDYQFKADFYILPLGGCDMVLGAQWLRTVGPILWDFGNLKMEFTRDDKRFLLNGNRKESLKVVSSHAIERIIYQDSSGYEVGTTNVAQVDDMLNKRNDVLRLLKTILAEEQNQMKQYADLHRT